MRARSASIRLAWLFAGVLGIVNLQAKEPVPALSQSDGESAEVSKLRRQLASEVWQERSRAIERAGQLGPLAKPLLEELCAATLEKNPQMRQAAVKTLDAVDPEFFTVVEDIILDGDESVRERAIDRLATLKGDAKPALPILMARFRSGRKGEAYRCLVTMHKIAPQDERVVRLIIDLAEKSSDGRIRGYSMQSLASLPREPKQTVRIVKMLDSVARSNATYRPIAMKELEEFGSAAKIAIPTLDSIRLTSKTSADRDLAKQVIASIEKAVQEEIKDAAPVGTAVDNAATDARRVASEVFLSDIQESAVHVWNYRDIKEFGFSKGGKIWEDGRFQDIVLAGQGSPKGIQTHPTPQGFASVVYDIEKFGKKIFRSRVGVADIRKLNAGSPLTFELVGDGKQLWKSKPVEKWGQAQECEAIISDLKKLELRVNCPGDASFARAVWCDPRLCDK